MAYAAFSSSISVTMMSRVMLNIRQQSYSRDHDTFSLVSTIPSLSFEPHDESLATTYESDPDQRTIQLDVLNRAGCC